MKERFRPMNPQEGERSAEDISEQIGKKLRERESKDEPSDRGKVTEKAQVAEDFSKKIADSFKERKEEPEKTEEVSKDLTVPSERKRGLTEVKQEDVSSVFSEVRDEKWDKETISNTILKIDSSLHDTKSSVHYVDIKATLSQEAFKDFEDAFRTDFDDIQKTVDEKRESETIELRQGMVDGKLYLWERDTDPMKLDNAYEQLYFYFKDEGTYNRYIQDATSALQENVGDVSDPRKHLDALLPQLIPDSKKGKQISDSYKRIRGDHIHFINDMMGQKLSRLEGKISLIRGDRGPGGLSNPRFPEGEKLETALSRFTATVVSDCTIESNGVIKYGESEMSRIRIVIDNLQVFGKINPRSKYIQGEGHYITHFPFVLGKLMIGLGTPAGDKTIQNRGLHPYIKDGNERNKSVYLEDLIPQDGCIGISMIIWTRTNALHAGDKTSRYRFESIIRQREIDFIIKEGRRRKDEYSLSWGKLKKLKAKYPEAVSTLKKSVYDNPNRLIEDEAQLARDLGIEIEVKPYMIRYYKKTGRVSISWNARTNGIQNAIKFGILAPPNDIIKRDLVRKMIKSHPQITSDILVELNEKRIRIDDWWNKESN